jgi:hypothetical protein
MSRVEVVARRYVLCPTCGKGEFTVEHLFSVDRDRRAGPWYCDNAECRMGFMVAVSQGGDVDLTPYERGDLPGLGLLKFRDLYLVVEEKHGAYVGDRAGSADYMYHSHQCPTNLLANVEAIYDASGSDPHGLMRHVASILDTPATRARLEEAGSLAELFALFSTDGKPAPTNWPEENRGVIA